MKKIKLLILGLCAAALSLFAVGCDLDEATCDHDYGATYTQLIKKATCTEEGEATYTCRKCYKKKDFELPMIAHEYDGGVIAKEASCTEKGMMIYTCHLCEGTIEEEIDMIAHRAQSVAMVAPTCTTAGTTAYSYCLRCNGFLTPKQEIPAFGHTPVMLKGIAATCTTTGLTSGSYCPDCGVTIQKQEVINANGHTVVTDKGQSPTCTVAGLSAGSHCSACGEVFKAQTVLEANGHEYGDDNACDVCGEHRHTEVVLSEVAATCTTAGRTAGVKCSECLMILEQQEIIPAFGHDMGDDGKCKVCGLEHEHTVVEIPAIAPTCATVGWTAGSECSSCGKVILAPQEVAKLSHNPTPIPAVAATCSATGLTEGSQCADCGEIITAQTATPIDSTKHTYNADMVCTSCGYVYYTVGLAYDSTGVITGIGSATDTVLYIPAIYNGNSVKIHGAFQGNQTITKVVFRGDIVLYPYEFDGCQNLETVIFEGEVTFKDSSYEYYQFRYCNKLTTVVHKGRVNLENNMFIDEALIYAYNSNLIVYADKYDHKYEDLIDNSYATLKSLSEYQAA